MKTLHCIFGVLLIATIARGQDLPAPTKLVAVLTADSSGINLLWTPPNGVSGGIMMSMYLLTKYTYYRNDSSQLVLIDSNEIPVELGKIPGVQISYIIHDAKPCNVYAFKVRVVGNKNGGNVRVESPSSDLVQIQTKGGVNAVVIYQTPDVVAVAGSDSSIFIKGCVGRPDGSLQFVLSNAPVWLTIEELTGKVRWHIPVLVRDTAFTATVVARDRNVAADTTTFKFQVRPSNILKSFVAGHAVLDGHAPVEVQLTLMRSDSNAENQQAKTDDAGNFRFVNVVNGRYRLSYSVADLNIGPFWYVHTTSTDSATVLEVHDNKPIDNIDIHIKAQPRLPIKISGHLRRSGNAITGASVTALDVGSFFVPVDGGGQHHRAKLRAAGSSRTDDNGQYSLILDSGGTYILLASAAGYQSTFIDTTGSSCVSPFCATRFSPGGTSQPTADGAMRPSDTSGQQITGTISDIAGTGVQAMIFLLKNSDGTITSGYSGGLVPFDVVTSDSATGKYSISSVPADTNAHVTYLLQAVPFDGYIPSYFAVNDSAQNTLLWENARMFSLDPMKRSPLEVDVLVKPLANGSGTISGHVVETASAGNSPSINAFVYAVDQTSMTPRGYAVTDGSGNFSISGLPASTYILFGDKVSFHYALEGEVLLSPADTNGSNGHRLVLTREVAGVADNAAPSSAILSSVYPNPFSQSAFIRVNAVPGTTVKMFDFLGRQVADLTGQVHSGSGLVVVSAANLVSGMYVCKLEDSRGTVTRPLLIVR